jgi:geranylgeranyl diphosphate synthase type I
MNLPKFAGDYLHQIETELRRAIGSGASALDAYYLMLTYHMGWVDADNQALPPGQGGKRIRPLLTLLTCAAAGGEAESALPVAAGIELLHNFSLLHDDIQDNSPLRRGRPTVWRLWGAPQAINAGDALFTLAHLAVLELGARGLPAAIALEVLGDFDRTCLALTQGQHLDMAFERRVRVTEAEYLTMIEGKTAALVSACARMGGRVAGAETERVEHLTQYGRHLGLAFQIHDDWLGIWGDPAVTGKSVASDLEARKKSLPVVFALERSDDFVKAYARPHLDGESVSELSQTLAHFGADQHTRELSAQHTRQALDHLAAARLTGPAADVLSEVTHQLLERAV